MKKIAKYAAFFAAVFFGMVFLEAAALGWTLPVRGAYTVGNGFWDCDRYCYHLGDDVAADADDEILSIGTGRVVEVTYRDNALNYGGRVLIQYDVPPGTRFRGPIVVLYGHLGPNTDDPVTDDIFVSVGDYVVEGQVIGRLGTRAENGGFTPHLHIGVHRGSYMGAANECSGWTYAGYTDQAFAPTDPCYCAILDNWYDPSEFLEVEPGELRLVSGTVTPGIGFTNDTQFTWRAEAVGGYGLPITAGVFVWNPTYHREYWFVMDYIEGTADPFAFEHRAQVLGSGTYEYRYRLQTCADIVDEVSRRIGPVASRAEFQYEEDEEPPAEDERDVVVEEEDEPDPPPEEPDCVSERETCDGEDNDCDGRIDNDASISCRSACGSGIMVCDIGRFLPCTAPGPQEEVCDGIDNDCNGIVDRMMERCITACGEGGHQCRAGRWEPCSAGEPTPEVCDYRDNDCDGDVDEDGNDWCWGSSGSGSGSGSGSSSDPPPSDPPPGGGGTPGESDSGGGTPPADDPPPEDTSGTDPPAEDPPPPPADSPPAAPALVSPPNGFVREVPRGANWSLTLDWEYVGGAGTGYEYVVEREGSVRAEGSMSGTMYVFYCPPEDYGRTHTWRVRAVNASGVTGSWSGTRTFSFAWME